MVAELKDLVKDLQAELMADDVEIDIERMKNWTVDEATQYFESGGEVAPGLPARGRGRAVPSTSLAGSRWPPPTTPRIAPAV